MKVKDIVLSAAQVLGIQEGVASYFDGSAETFKREGELLLACFNAVECGLALEYLPLYAEDELLTPTKRLEFSSFTYAPVRILNVADQKGNAVAYTLYPKYLNAQVGRLKVTYTYTPDKKDIDGESDFSLLVADTLFVYGVLAEYCMAEGRFEEASEWDKKYKEAIESVIRTRSCKRLSSRRWV